MALRLVLLLTLAAPLLGLGTRSVGPRRRECLAMGPGREARRAAAAMGSAVALFFGPSSPFVSLPLLPSSSLVASADSRIPKTPSRGFQTQSGLKYFDLSVGDESLPTPRYGQLVSFYCSMYYQPFAPSDATPEERNGKYGLELIDESYSQSSGLSFLHKHGSSRIIRAVDEALHTMHPFAVRRIIVPPFLGYVDSGLGPLPTNPFHRRKLGDVLGRVQAKQGQLLMDLQLVMVADDENDQGYYDDVPVSREEVEQTMKVILQSQREEKARREAQQPPSPQKQQQPAQPAQPSETAAEAEQEQPDVDFLDIINLDLK